MRSTPRLGTGPEREEVPATLVWIHDEEALIVRWNGGARIEKVGAGVPRRAFIRTVAMQVPPGDDVRIVGPGDVRLRLGRMLRDQDRRLCRHRTVDTRSSGALTERELVAHVREIAGDPPLR